MTRVLIIDDNPAQLAVLHKVLAELPEALRIESFTSPHQALNWARLHTAALVLNNYNTPFMDGIESTRRLRRLPAYRHTPVLLLTSRRERFVHYRALEGGVTDFLSKPIDPMACHSRCTNLLRMTRFQGALEAEGLRLAMETRRAARRLWEHENEILLRLARAGEYRDEGTGKHVVRMARYARVLAESLGLSESECDILEQAAPMHDIGKVGIPDQVLLKPGKLDESERTLMQTHAHIGYEILRESPSECLQMGAVIAHYHHESYNGKGYPEGLAGEEIPLPARIVAVADVYDALISARPYKDAWSHQSAVNYLLSQRGKQFDPDCVDAFYAHFGELAALSIQADALVGTTRLQ